MGFTFLNKKPDANDEEAFWKGFNNNYGSWLTLGSLSPRAPIFVTYLFSTTLISAMFLVLTAYATAYTDLALFFECIHFLVLISVSLSFWLAFLINRKYVFEIYRLIGIDFYDYGETLDNETREEVGRIMKETRDLRLNFMRIFTICAFMTYSIMNILRPILKYLKGEHLKGTPDDGMFRLLPVTFWAPIEVNTYSQIFFFLLVEISSMNSFGVIVGHNMFFLTACEEFATQCNVISLTMRNVVQRAKSISEPGKYTEGVKLALAKSIKHHQLIIEAVQILERIVYMPSLVNLLASTFMLCVSGFLFISDKLDTVSKISFSLFMISELLCLWVYCFCAERVKTASSEIFTEIYFGDWMENMQLIKNYNLLIQARTFNGLQISAGGFMYLNLETYSNVLSSAFSYFNILNAMSS